MNWTDMPWNGGPTWPEIGGRHAVKCWTDMLWNRGPTSR